MVNLAEALQWGHLDGLPTSSEQAAEALPAERGEHDRIPEGRHLLRPVRCPDVLRVWHAAATSAFPHIAWKPHAAIACML